MAKVIHKAKSPYIYMWTVCGRGKDNTEPIVFRWKEVTCKKCLDIKNKNK